MSIGVRNVRYGLLPYQVLRFGWFDLGPFHIYLDLKPTRYAHVRIGPVSYGVNF